MYKTVLILVDEVKMYMRIKVLHIDKTQSSAIQDLCDDFQKRAGRFMRLEVLALPKVKGSNLSTEEQKAKEGEQIMKQIGNTDFLVIMDEKGKSQTSREFAEWIRLHYVNDPRELVFVIGGAYGFSKAIYERADVKLSMSSMTFNHELALLVLSEQIYRAATIIHGHPYHND